MTMDLDGTGFDKFGKADQELLDAARELLAILKEDSKALRSGDTKRIRVVSACLRVLIADTHPKSTKGLLRYLATKYKFTEPVDNRNEDLEAFLDASILFETKHSAKIISHKQIILSESQNDGLAHESHFRSGKNREQEEIMDIYRLWLDSVGSARWRVICDIADAINDYGERLVTFLQNRELEPLYQSLL